MLAAMLVAVRRRVRIDRHAADRIEDARAIGRPADHAFAPMVQTMAPAATSWSTEILSWLLRPSPEFAAQKI